MIDSASCKQVSRNELTPGGTIAAISAIRSSGIGPGPLGIADTKPIADAPASIAIHASSMLAMQQIFTRGLVVVGLMVFDYRPLRATSLHLRHSFTTEITPGSRFEPKCGLIFCGDLCRNVSKCASGT